MNAPVTNPPNFFICLILAIRSGLGTGWAVFHSLRRSKKGETLHVKHSIRLQW